jgi:hypothetical protein
MKITLAVDRLGAWQPSVQQQGPKTGKFDYLSEPKYSARLIAFKFFTDDDLPFRNTA